MSTQTAYRTSVHSDSVSDQVDHLLSQIDSAQANGNAALLSVLCAKLSALLPSPVAIPAAPLVTGEAAADRLTHLLLSRGTHISQN